MVAATIKTKYDYKSLTKAELRDFSELLHTLDEADWERSTLCEGWKVRHIVGHLVAGYSTPLPKLVWTLATQYRFNFPKAAHEVSTRTGEQHSPKELLAMFDEWALRDQLIGIASIEPFIEHFLDHMIHQWDITVPMGHPRQVPEERRLIALNSIVKVLGLSGMASGKKLAAGLKLRATDLEWSWGNGPEVAGKTPYLILALSGRQHALADLKGEGVNVLRKRLSPAK